MNTFLEIIEKAAIIIASITAIYGINSWRRETTWKRKYELAEEVLSLFYEVRENLKLIRSPFSFTNEGSSRKKSENETAQETEKYNEAYVYIERYEKLKEPFIKLKTLKYRFMAVFGKQCEFSFDEVQDCLGTVLATYDLLCNHYWKKERTAPKSQEHLESLVEKIESLESIIWSNTSDNDEIDKRISDAINKIEEIVRNIIKK